MMDDRKGTAKWKMYVLILALIFVQLPLSKPAAADVSGDAYINYNAADKIWTIGTAKVEKQVQLNASGQFLLITFFNKLTSREYVQGTQSDNRCVSGRCG